MNLKWIWWFTCRNAVKIESTMNTSFPRIVSGWREEQVAVRSNLWVNIITYSATCCKTLKMLWFTNKIFSWMNFEILTITCRWYCCDVKKEMCGIQPMWFREIRTNSFTFSLRSLKDKNRRMWRRWKFDDSFTIFALFSPFKRLCAFECVFCFVKRGLAWKISTIKRRYKNKMLWL